VAFALVLLDSVLVCVYDSVGGAMRFALWPWLGKGLVVEDIEGSSDTDVTMLGAAQSMNWCRSGSGVVVEIPALSVDEVPCKYAYVRKITRVKSL